MWKLAARTQLQLGAAEAVRCEMGARRLTSSHSSDNLFSGSSYKRNSKLKPNFPQTDQKLRITVRRSSVWNHGRGRAQRISAWRCPVRRPVNEADYCGQSKCQLRGGCNNHCKDAHQLTAPPSSGNQPPVPYPGFWTLSRQYSPCTFSVDNSEGNLDIG